MVELNERARAERILDGETLPRREAEEVSDAILTRDEREGKTVEIVVLNEASSDRRGRLTGEIASR